MKDCACGRPERPLVPVLLALPVILGALAGLVLLAAKGTPWQRDALVLTGAAFGLLVGGLVWLGVRVLMGSACAGCLRGRTR